MGVGHSDKKLDRMAQNAIDAMNAPGPRRSKGGSKKSSSGSLLSPWAWILFMILGFLIAATS